MSATLHYIYDPLCGWCYGAEPLVWSAAKAADVELELHGGALWPEPTHLPESTRLYIRQADQRIAQMSGQRFGPDYHNGLLVIADPVKHTNQVVPFPTLDDKRTMGNPAFGAAANRVDAVPSAYWSAAEFNPRDDASNPNSLTEDELGRGRGRPRAGRRLGIGFSWRIATFTSIGFWRRLLERHRHQLPSRWRRRNRSIFFNAEACADFDGLSMGQNVAFMRERDPRDRLRQHAIEVRPA